MLKQANPDGRFWIKIDGTDVKTALMESMRGEWNGDVDLGDGELQMLRENYDERLKGIVALAEKGQSRESLVSKLSVRIKTISDDVNFLNKGFTAAINKYKEKYSAANCPFATLKDCNWDVVEYQTFLEDVQAIRSAFEKCKKELASDCNDQKLKSSEALLKDGTLKSRLSQGTCLRKSELLQVTWR